MKKWHEWAFVVLLVALAVAGGWSKDRQTVNFADADTETTQG